MEYKVLNNFRPSELELDLNIHAAQGWKIVAVQKMEKYTPVNQKTDYYTMIIMERAWDDLFIIS